MAVLVILFGLSNSLMNLSMKRRVDIGLWIQFFVHTLVVVPSPMRPMKPCLEHLTGVDERFARYSSTLFSQTSLEVNREQQTQKENDKLNKSISSYLRLLAGYLQLPAALKTLEYLIRRYLVHVYNVDELLLCALPYHDTHAFVRIVQLVNLGNSKWTFLDGVKSSGAPPPRNVLVQQCIRDTSLLETFSNYDYPLLLKAAPKKGFLHSRTVVCFCTAVIVECLGAIPKLDSNIVQRVVGYVFDSLNPDIGADRDYKAGALMIVGVLATRATLAPKLVQDLIIFVARAAQHDALESVDLPWLRVTVMAIISLVQSQSVQEFRKKPLMILKDIRDFSGVLSVLSSEFNIENFVRLYVESLVDCSTSDESCHVHLIETMETLPIKNFVERIVRKVLGNCIKASRVTDNPDINRTGIWAKKIFAAIEKKYSCELRDAIRKFLEESEINSVKGDSTSKLLSLVFDESKSMPSEISDANIWFSLDHPKAVVRQSALSKIAKSDILKKNTANPQKFINMQDAIIRSLYDDDLSVVQAALSIEGLAAISSPRGLLKAYDDLLVKCTDIIHKGGSKASKACDVAVSCLEKMVMEYQVHHMEHAKDIATVVFGLLIVHPKTLKVNLKALELAKKIQWDFYASSPLVYELTAPEVKNVPLESIASINMKNIQAFAETFLSNPNKHVEWLADCGNRSSFSRTLFLLIVLQALLIPTEVLDKQVNLCQVCLPALKNEWSHIQPKGDCIGDEISIDNLEKCITELVKHIFNNDTDALNARILVCIFWGLLRVQSSYVKQNSMIDAGENTALDDLFMYFITSPDNNIFQKHLQYLVANCTGAPIQFISKYLVDEGLSAGVQAESLLVLASICSTCALSESSSMDESLCMQLLRLFPSLIVPLSHENKDVRSSAMKFIEGLSLVWQRLSTSVSKNGNNGKFPMSSPAFGVFLESLANQKAMISSDARFLPAYISSMLSPSQDLMVPENLHERIDQPTKDAILNFILHSSLKLSPYGKLMVLSALKGVGSILFKAEEVKSLFLYLLDRRSQHQSGHDSKQILTTHETQILCLLLEVLFAVEDQTNFGSETFEALLKALKVDGLSHEDPVAVMPCLTALQNLQPVFFENLKNDTKDKVFGLLISLFRAENLEIRNATRDALLRINVCIHILYSIYFIHIHLFWPSKISVSEVHASTFVKFIELVVAHGDERGNPKRIKRSENLNRDNHFEEYFGEHPVSSILVSLLDILFLMKNVNERLCLLQPLCQILSKLLSDQWISGIVCQYNKGSSETLDVPSFVKETQQLVLLTLKDIIDTLQSGYQDNLLNNGNVNLLINFIRSTEDVGTRNHGLSLIASLAKAFPQLVSENIIDLFVAIGDAVKQFILLKLQDTELRFELEAEEAANSIQNSLGTLMEEVVLCTVSVKDKKGDISGDILKEVRNNSNTVLKIITGWMHASTYFKGITRLLEHPEGLVKRKTLGILCETARVNNMVQNKQRKARKLKRSSLSTALQVDKSSCPYFSELCYKILELIDRESDTSVKIAAISSLETLAKEYPSENPAYSKCLATIISHISSGDSVTSSGLINTAGSLINVLGSKALPQLPLIMKNMLQRAHLVSCCPSGKYAHGSPRTDASLSNQSVIVQKLGEFVSPYLEEILDLVILHPECATQIDSKLDVKAADVRGLLTETVPVRLILPPLLNLYSSATKCGDASLSLSFQMLANVVGTMDRLAVGTYHTKIYEHCLEALDLRRQNLDSLKNINLVEQSIIHTIITLTMKLTESTFRPVFLRTLEWAESEVDQSTSKRSMDRAIVFYKLVNKLAEQHRSLFTPYFKYLLEGSVQYLSEDGVLISSKRKKKAKLGDDIVKYKDSLSGQKLWNLRALILKSLHKCFLYDNDQKILDSSNFQTLLKPIVSQFVAEPPESLDSVPDAPSVEEVDEILVSCLGQMAVTARSDVLWKPLNHEVLMQTRSDNVRPKMLGLKVVRYMVQHLKEEYVALVPETIPFLGELLEDVELPVKTLSQEILKEMETLSGESLREYL
uniref:BP28 C-terminal domain-containing protein n=1 Tax=Aegilops tauschii TaxID=37682 RepID=R7W4R5_AEGTA